MRRRDFIRTTGAGVALAGVAGCSNLVPGEVAGDGLSLAIVSGPGGFGDNAYNDLALLGLENAVAEYGGEVEEVEGSGGEYRSLHRQLAESEEDFDLIVCVGNTQADALRTSADEFPDQYWMLINQGLVRENGDHYENVAGYVWANHEMSFQAGVAAATMTNRSFSYAVNHTLPDRAVVGFVGGVESALIRAFERAYVAGVAHLDERVDVRVGYAGSFENPTAGREIAMQQFENGADIVYHAAARTGEGVFDAAQEANRFAIGVDADQSETLPEYSDVIMGSAVKYINVGTFRVAEAVHRGNWEDVRGKHVLGLAEDAVAFVPGVDIGAYLPEALDENLQETKNAIENGDVDVPCEATGCS